MDYGEVYSMHPTPMGRMVHNFQNTGGVRLYYSALRILWPPGAKLRLPLYQNGHYNYPIGGVGRMMGSDKTW